MSCLTSVSHTSRGQASGKQQLKQTLVVAKEPWGFFNLFVLRVSVLLRGRKKLKRAKKWFKIKEVLNWSS